MKHINLIAKEAKLPQRTLPTLPPEFYPWANLVHKDFLELWTVADPAGCCFAIGHALGEVRNGCIVLNLALDFQTNLDLDCTKELQDIPPRLKQALQRWAVAQQILGENSVGSLSKRLLEGLQAQIQTIEQLTEDQIKGWPLLQSVLQRLLPMLATAEPEIIQSLPSITDQY